MEMKESEMLRKAEIAVVESRNLTNYEKLEIIKYLAEKEALALFVEKEGIKNE